MRVITFSRFFPSKHPRKGEPTYFVEKIWNDIQDSFFDQLPQLNLDPMIEDKKGHTIRAGNRWKVGDFFSPRVWSGLPYRSKQIQFAPLIEIKKVWNFVITPHKENGYSIHINKNYVADWKFKTANIMLKEVAKNDGLSKEDFIAWFDCVKNPHFIGQVICWNEKINYY